MLVHFENKYGREEKHGKTIIDRYIKYITTCRFLRNQYYLQISCYWFKEEISLSNSQNQFFKKRMFVLKESKDRRKVWVFWSEHSRKWEIHFVFCVTEHLRHMVSVLDIGICSQDLQEIIIYKTIKKTLLQSTKDFVSETTIFFRSSHQKCSTKRLFLNGLQYSQENTCVVVSF